MRVPDWWEFLLLGLAAFRIFRLIAEDDIFDWPRRKLLRLGKKWEKEGDPVPKEFREKWSLFITCPWCLGFWLSLAWWGAFQIWPHGSVVAATPFAISAFLALTRRNLDPPEE